MSTRTLQGVDKRGQAAQGGAEAAGRAKVDRHRRRSFPALRLVLYHSGERGQALDVGLARIFAWRLSRSTSARELIAASSRAQQTAHGRSCQRAPPRAIARALPTSHRARRTGAFGRGRASGHSSDARFTSLDARRREGAVYRSATLLVARLRCCLAALCPTTSCVRLLASPNASARNNLGACVTLSRQPPRAPRSDLPLWSVVQSHRLLAASLCATQAWLRSPPSCRC